MWSQTSIPGRPQVLVIDLSCNKAGWEAEFCAQLVDRLQRRSIGLACPKPVQVGALDNLLEHGHPLEGANSLVVITHAASDDPAASVELRACWRWLGDHVKGPKLFVGCSWQHYDHGVNDEILAGGGFAPLAVVPRTPVNARETGLFLLKLFMELHLHTDTGGSISGKMLWFSWSKARELLKRRGMAGQFAAQC